jgi:Fe-S cluster assembly protein SufD
MNNEAYFKNRFDKLELADNSLAPARKNAIAAFTKAGIPGAKHEEWKYTRIGSLFNKEYQFPAKKEGFGKADLDGIRLPGHEGANELVFVNGIYSAELSEIRSKELVVQSLEEAAANEYKDIVSNNFGHSGNHLKDGINALNTAFVQGGVFLYVNKGSIVSHPVYIYTITDARQESVLSQPRSLIYIGENAQVELVETYVTIGKADSFTNQVMEVAIEKDARVGYYKIQNDRAQANLVSTTHFRQLGKSYLHTVTITLNGGIIRNNLNVVLEAEHCESHLYGLYFLGGESHIDNHTIVDNVKPNCYSNELYKGVMTGKAVGVFNGKIFVRKDAQKTNAYQSNKNILLSPDASVNTKPQLEIFADDVKCSHGCTVGQLDEDALFYLQSRGVPAPIAQRLLVRAYATDILEHITPKAIHDYIEQLISHRLEYDLA